MNSVSVNSNPNYFGVSIDNNHIYDNFLKRSSFRRNSASAPLAVADSVSNNNDKKRKYTDTLVALGYINTAAQAISGLMFTGLAISSLKDGHGWKAVEDTSKIYTGNKQKIYQLAMGILSVGYFIGVPAVFGAGVKAEQPGIVTTSVLDGILAGFMLNKKFNNSTRFHGLQNFNYAPSYAGFANKTSNEFNAQDENDIRKMNLGFLLQRDTYLKLFSSDEKGAEARNNMSNMAKFVAMDVVYAFKNAGKAVGKTIKQTGEWISGKREERPDIFTMKPSKDSMSLGAVLIMAGSLPKLILGNKLGKIKRLENLGKNKNINLVKMPIIATDLLIGSGMMFESLGMMNLANAKDDSRKWPVILTTPFRILGDFMQQRPLMKGVRTAAASSYEYYVTLMNKEENGQLTH